MRYAFRSALTCILLTGMLSGCEGIRKANLEMKEYLYGDYSPRKIEEANYDPNKLIRDALKKDLKTNGSSNDYCFKPPAQSEQKDWAYTCKPHRKTIAYIMLQASNDLCEAHLRTIYGNDAAYNLFFGSLTNILAGSATIVGGAQTKSILAGLAALSSAERSLINETVYRSIVVPNVVKKINQTRKQEVSNLIAGLDSKTIELEPMDKTISDIVEIHSHCSFMHGLQLAFEEGAQDGAALKLAKLEQQRTLLLAQLDARESFVRSKGTLTTDDPIYSKWKVEFDTISNQILAMKQVESPGKGGSGNPPAASGDSANEGGKVPEAEPGSLGALESAIKEEAKAQKVRDDALKLTTATNASYDTATIEELNKTKEIKDAEEALAKKPGDAEITTMLESLKGELAKLKEKTKEANLAKSDAHAKLLVAQNKLDAAKIARETAGTTVGNDGQMRVQIIAFAATAPEGAKRTLRDKGFPEEAGMNFNHLAFADSLKIKLPKLPHEKLVFLCSIVGQTAC
ncbi:MAG: hypothetical protein HQM06_17840, partial [Magnetococcales bacterium]|nr:hypothetical protein [Magnetococcales bacterium]